MRVDGVGEARSMSGRPCADRGEQRTKGTSKTRLPLLRRDFTAVNEVPLSSFLVNQGPLDQFHRLRLTNADVADLAHHLGGTPTDVPCLVVGHRGRGRFEAVGDDDWQFLCCKDVLRPIGELAHCVAVGRDERISNVAIATWLRRLAWEAGVIDVDRPQLRKLRPPVTPAVQRVVHGFALLCALRWYDGPPRPLPYATRFAAAWTSVSAGTAADAIKRMNSDGVIDHAGQRGSLNLYLPAPALLIDEEGTEEAVVQRIKQEFDADELGQ